MRASTFFAFNFAILFGLAAVAGGRYYGLFDRGAAPAAAPKVEPVKVLAARGNLFAGMTVGAADVAVRDLAPDEEAAYRKNPAAFLPPLPDVTKFRILSRNVEANTPLTKDHLEPQALPDGLTKRLAPNMRAVNLVLPKERAAGGLLRVGEHVDVYLTTAIAADREDGPAPTLRTGCIARSLRVVVKRDMLWPALVPADADKPVHLTVEANPYRAALLEFAKEKGQLSLVPVPAPAPAEEPKGTAFADPTSREYKEEDTRVAGLLRGERTVGDGDLARIFDLRPIPARPAPIRVEHLSGLKHKGFTEYPVAVAAAPMADANPDQPNLGYRFSPPAPAGPAGAVRPAAFSATTTTRK